LDDDSFAASLMRHSLVTHYVISDVLLLLLLLLTGTAENTTPLTNAQSGIFFLHFLLFI